MAKEEKKIEEPEVIQQEEPEIKPEEPKELIDLPEDDQRKIRILYVDHLYDNPTKTKFGLLTETQKTDLTDGGESTAHIHDGRYYTEAEVDDLHEKTFTAGQQFTGIGSPYPVFIKDSDDKVYLCDANNTTRLNFDGFVLANAAQDADCEVALLGVVGNFSGLDPGKKYYVQDSIGTIGTTIGTYPILVGIAISSTEILISKEGEVIREKVVSANLHNSNDSEQNTSSESYVKVKEVQIGADLEGCRLKFDLKVSGGTVFGKVYKNGVAEGTEQSESSTSYVTKSEDFTGFSSGDLIQIYLKVTYDDPPRVGYVENMRFYYDDKITRFGSIKLITELLATALAIPITNQDP